MAAPSGIDHSILLGGRSGWLGTLVRESFALLLCAAGLNAPALGAGATLAFRGSTWGASPPFGGRADRLENQVS